MSARVAAGRIARKKSPHRSGPGWRQTRRRSRNRRRPHTGRSDARSLAEMELNESLNEALDVEGLLAFAENALINAGSVWSSATVSVKQDVQWAFFPQGLRFDG